MNSVTQFGFEYDAFDIDYAELQAACNDVSQYEFCSALAEQDTLPHDPQIVAMMAGYWAEQRQNLQRIRSQWDAEMQEKGHADYGDYARQVRAQQAARFTPYTPIQPGCYRELTLRERVQINRQEEARKHAAYVARHNRTATAGIRKLHQAVSKANQPVQLSLF